ncbi:JAB domain-containing protein [Streptomyces atratus]|uniref:JAB domain-containing protein n=1 Tax=Streptomyces atratus TaxID=1893 RepID=UPI00364715E9
MIRGLRWTARPPDCQWRPLRSFPQLFQPCGVRQSVPTGRTDPSEADRRATTRLVAGAAAVGLRFLDHVVVTDGGWRRVAPE